MLMKTVSMQFQLEKPREIPLVPMLEKRQMNSHFIFSCLYIQRHSNIISKTLAGVANAGASGIHLGSSLENSCSSLHKYVLNGK